MPLDPLIFPANMQELSASTMYSNFTATSAEFSVGTGLFTATVRFIVKYKILSARTGDFRAPADTENVSCFG